MTTLAAPVDGANILKNVKLLGRESKNGYEYSTSAMREAVSLYRGVRVFLGHGRDEPDRHWDDWVGVVENPRFHEDGIYGDIRLRRKAPKFDELMEAAAEFAGCFGCSHVAEGSPRNGVVQRILEVHSVDIVCVPATTNGLYEGMRSADLTDEERRLRRELEETLADVERDGEIAAELPDGTDRRRVLTRMRAGLAAAKRQQERLLIQETAIRESFLFSTFFGS